MDADPPLATDESAAIVVGPLFSRIRITVSGLPSGLPADILVTGPSGYSRTVTDSQTLLVFQNGTYNITASTVSEIGTSYRASVSPSSVTISTSGELEDVTVSHSACDVPVGTGCGSRSGSISPAGDEDSYEFIVNENGGYLLEVSSTLTTVHLRIYGPDCSDASCLIVSSTAVSGSAVTLDYNDFLWQGTYTAEISSSATGTGSYTFSVSKLGYPTPSSSWLTRKGTGSEAESDDYYATIDPSSAKTTLADWKTENGFGSTAEVSATYFNAGDLGFGREMHCLEKSNGNIACYVTNYGGLGGKPEDALADAVARADDAATVAMEWSPVRLTTPVFGGGPPITTTFTKYAVKFYVFGGSAAGGARLTKVALDSEGDKQVPHICLSCHGGTYDSSGHRVENASFLPFDLESFQYSTDAGFTQADQEEAFRQLNAMVKSTRPADAIEDLIDGWYGGTVDTAGTTFDSSYVPSGWSGASSVYRLVVKPYCRTCHTAQDRASNYQFLSESDFTGLVGSSFSAPCGYYDMPHAELIFQKFWSGNGPAYLESYYGITCDP